MVIWFSQQGIDEKRVVSQLRLLAGLGNAYLKEARSIDQGNKRDLLFLAAGTNFRRAGANALLLQDGGRARGFFKDSSIAYSLAHSPYAHFMQNLATPVDAVLESSEATDDPRNVYLLWSARKPGKFDLGHLRDRLTVQRTKLVGLLRISVGSYLDLFDAIDESEMNVASIRENLLPLVMPYVMALKNASLDSHHWTRLITPFHPLDPDTVALLVALNRRLTPYQIEVAKLLREMNLGATPLAILSEALRHFTPQPQGPDANTEY